MLKRRDRFIIEDTGLVSSPVLAWACIRLDRLQSGYRYVKLMDMKGCQIPGGKLFLRIEKILR